MPVHDMLRFDSLLVGCVELDLTPDDHFLTIDKQAEGMVLCLRRIRKGWSGLVRRRPRMVVHSLVGYRIEGGLIGVCRLAETCQHGKRCSGLVRCEPRRQWPCRP